jgi:hypothetical protein
MMTTITTNMMNLSSSINDTTFPDVAESLAVMMQKERTVYTRRDYLSNIRAAVSSSIGIGLQKANLLDKEDRAKMVDWCYCVVDMCQLDRETVAVAMDMVDRFLSSSNNSKKSIVVAMDVLGDRIQFQLLTLTALYISIKISSNLVLGSNFFSVISRDLYTLQEIEAMELVLLKELAWCISPPTCVQISYHIVSLISTQVTFDKNAWAAILDEVDHQAEHAVRHYDFVTQRPSTVAMAAIFNALGRFDKHESQGILSAVLSIMNTAEFESIEVILATRSKLHSLVYGHESTGDDWDVEECDAAVDETDQWYL